MKKVLLLITLFVGSFSVNAQKANIQSAINYLKDNDIANAKKMVDEATQSESTKNNAKAWLLKAVIYQAIATPKEFMPQLNFILNETPYMLDLSAANALKSSEPNANELAYAAYKKSIELDPKYSKEELSPLLSTLLLVNFNQGITYMNDSKFADAFRVFEFISGLATADFQNFWKGNGQIDTLFANSKLYQANSAYQIGKEEEALPIFEECIKNPITQTPDLYIMISDIYEKKNNEEKWTEVMKAAKAKYPKDKRILNNEINYYLKTGKAEQCIAKLKEGIVAEPGKADLYVILGQTYYNMANPQDKSGKALAKAANAKELEGNALTNYTKAAELDPKNAYTQFYIGLFHFNHAKEVTDEINKETDDKKYAALVPGRDAIINKGLPYLEKARSLLDAEGLNDSNKGMYKQILQGLMQSFSITGKTEKSTEIQNALDKLN